MSAEPKYDKKTGVWTRPEGYAHPRCKCGHNFYSAMPRLKNAKGAPVYWQCQWCAEESQ